jgi:hypothetical protein
MAPGAEQVMLGSQVMSLAMSCEQVPARAPQVTLDR